VILLSERSISSLPNRAQHHSPVHRTSVAAIARNDVSERPRSRCKRALVRTLAGVILGSGLRRFVNVILLPGSILTTLLLYAATAGAESPLPGPRLSGVEDFAPFITEASRRFAIPTQWIRGVMQLESSGDRRAVSPKGALGLMQIMPGTWVELSVRYGLGIDPYDPHDNIMAGAAYLREMHDRFGSSGVFAAYNAGPERYQRHLTTGRSLPPETQAYVAALSPVVGRERWDDAAFAIHRMVPWRKAPLFPGHLESASVDRHSASSLRLESTTGVLSTASPAGLAPLAEGLFVRQSNEVRAR
jgi:hypothetical protein